MKQDFGKPIIFAEEVTREFGFTHASDLKTGISNESRKVDFEL